MIQLDPMNHIYPFMVHQYQFFFAWPEMLSSITLFNFFFQERKRANPHPTTWVQIGFPIQPLPRTSWHLLFESWIIFKHCLMEYGCSSCPNIHYHFIQFSRWDANIDKNIEDTLCTMFSDKLWSTWLSCFFSNHF